MRRPGFSGFSSVPGELHKLKLYQDPVFADDLYGLSAKLRATETRVWLKSGSYLVVENPRRPTVIDVNSEQVQR